MLQLHIHLSGQIYLEMVEDSFVLLDVVNTTILNHFWMKRIKSRNKKNRTGIKQITEPQKWSINLKTENYWWISKHIINDNYDDDEEEEEEEREEEG